MSQKYLKVIQKAFKYLPYHILARNLEAKFISFCFTNILILISCLNTILCFYSCKIIPRIWSTKIISSSLNFKFVVEQWNILRIGSTIRYFHNTSILFCYWLMRIFFQSIAWLPGSACFKSTFISPLYLGFFKNAWSPFLGILNTKN